MPGRLLRRLIGGKHEVSARTIVLWAFVLGALGGAAEATYLALRQVINHQPATWYNPDVRWTAPIVAAVASGLLGALLAGFAWLTRSRFDFEKVTLLFAFPGVYAVATSPGIPLHPIAKLVLSVGIASVIARAAAARTGWFTRSMRQVAATVAVMLLVLGAWGAATLPAVAERRALGRLGAAPDGAPNVVLLILDTVRAANLGLYGYHRSTSPNLDHWARSGVVFDRAVATAPWTLPSHASMFTGHFNVTARTAIDRPLDSRFTTLAEALRDNGYATAAFTANLGYTTRTSGLARGFARFEDFPPTLGIALRSSWLARTLISRFGWMPGIPDWPIPKTAERMTDDVEAWLAARRTDRPFFLFVNYYDAHGPYLAPTAFRQRFGPPAEVEATSERPWTTAELATSINAYDGSIAYVDDQLRRLFDLLARRGLQENTLVIVTSDHGEMFGEHGQTAHTSGLYFPALHVPLALVYPKVVPAGMRVAPPVTLRDLPATIVDLAGLADKSPFPGHSLARHWRPEPESGPASPVLSEIDHYAWAPTWTPVYRGDMRSLVDGPLHYIRNGDGVEELYKPSVDPAETHNRIADASMQPAVAKFRAIMDSLFRR